MSLDAVPLLDVWRRLGGQEPRGNRAPAFWRKSRDLNISLDPDRGCWYDFVAGSGGGILALVMIALGVNHVAALEWLVREGFIEGREFTEEEKREFARGREAAEREAEDAGLFAVAAVAVAEELLEEGPLLDPSRPDLTALVADLRHDRQEVYREFKLDRPKLTQALVFAGRLEYARREEWAAQELGGLLRHGA